MRKLFVIGALGVLATPALAQHVWQPEIGVQAGFSSVTPAGRGANATTFIDLPGGTFLNALLTYAPLYAVIPAGRRLAVEPQLGFDQVNVGGTAATLARVGLRLDYGFGSGFYGAAGGVLNYVSPSSAKTQVGLQAGVGYRRHLGGSINGRIEANWVTTHSSDLLQAFNAYSVLLGVSSSLGGAAAERPSRATATQAWSPVFGIVGGYGSAHVIGSGGAISGVFLPGLTNSLGVTVQGPPTLFAIVPLGGKWAIEPGLDLHHVSPPTGSGTTTLEIGARIDYAVTSGWYAAAGGQVTDVNPPTGSSGNLTGADVAWGYRFHLAGPTGGRVELNYLMTGKSDKLGIPPINTFSVLFGLTMPLR